MARATKVARILLPTDFSPASRAAYPEAVARAKSSGATVVLLNVVDVLPLMPIEGGVAPVYRDGFLADAKRSMKKELRRFRGIRVRPVVAEGPPADEILRQVKKQECGLIVMGSHGRRGFARWLLGSVAERVLRGSACPVMVVKPKR